MIGIYKKQISEDEFLFLPKEACPYPCKNGVLHIKGNAYFSSMSPVVVTINENTDEIFQLLTIDYPIHGLSESIFLLGQMSRELSMTTKKKILSVTGYDLLSFARKKEAEKILIHHFPAIKKSLLLELVEKLRRMDNEKRLVDLLYEKGIRTKVIEKVITAKVDYEQILKNPFLTWTGLDPFSAEKLCESLQPYDDQRICGFVMYAVELFLSRGDTYVTFDKLYALVNRLIVSSMYPEQDIPRSFVYLAVKKMAKYLTMDVVGDVLCVYKTKVYLEEKKIAQQIQRLSENKVEVVKHIDWEAIELQNGFTYNEGQKAAFDCVKTSGVKIITGPPGAGKTALIEGLIYAFREEYPHASIALAATTGAAAQVLSNACGYNGKTVHKLLDLRPCGDIVLCKGEGDPLDAMLIVVDEVSMLDLEVASYLFSAVKNGAILILSGDDNQLESVGYGKVLADLIACGKTEVYRLTQVMRQSGTICENAECILHGSTNIKTDENFFFWRFQTNKEAVDHLINHLDIFHSFVLGPVKQDKDAGVFSLNQKIQDLIPDKTYCFSYGENDYYENDRIIMIETDYDSGYFNGDIGYLRSYVDGTATVEFRDRTLYLSRKDFANMQLAYSITVHKSQGSEIDDVHVLLPEGCPNMLTRRILYTAITRAKQRVFLYSVGDSFEYAVGNTAEYKRQTNLVYRIQEEKNKKKESDSSI